MTKQNYIIIAIALIIIVIGFLMMTGSTTMLDYNPDIFSFRRITLAPIVTIIGFVLMIVGIMFKSKSVNIKD
ncbi:MAG: DUF3098 domain-containing protein [Prevotellaceae bacterium]|jgi:uncharacterized membrane protein|nr:DUF3098 domain-containing protein [Prevotellaceae bacterium]